VRRSCLCAVLCTALTSLAALPVSIPRLVKKVEYGDYGSKYHRIGDLDGDSVPDLLLVQVTAPGGEHKAIITCLTALTLDGKLLWQFGKPDPKNIYFGGDFPVQIYDHDADGTNEVFFIQDDRNILTILDGKTGTRKRDVKLAGGHDSLLFVDFAGAGYARDLVVKDRYKSFWVYDGDFRLLWSRQDVNPGHFPMNYDLDGDGRDELLMGYTLYSRCTTTLSSSKTWTATERRRSVSPQARTRSCSTPPGKS
jgi:rhamnogalacturonan endolyase